MAGVLYEVSKPWSIGCCEAPWPLKPWGNFSPAPSQWPCICMLNWTPIAFCSRNYIYLALWRFNYCINYICLIYWLFMIYALIVCNFKSPSLCVSEFETFWDLFHFRFARDQAHHLQIRGEIYKLLGFILLMTR